MWAADNWKNSELLKVRQIILKIFQCGNVKRCSKETGTPIIEFWAIATYLQKIFLISYFENSAQIT